MMIGNDALRALVAPLQAVLLDLDGTLLDTVHDLAAAANAARVEFGMPALAPERIGSFVGKGADVLMHRTITDDPDGRLPDAEFARAREAFDRHYARENGLSARPYPGVTDALPILQSLGLGLACVTNKPQVFTDPLLERQQMAGYFSQVLGGDALARKKPEPDQLLHVARAFGLAPAQCLMIGDSGNDAAAARAAGMPVLILPYGYNEGRDVATIDCDGIVPTVRVVADAFALVREAPQA